MQSQVDQLTKGQTSNMLTGDTGLACEAIICLSSGTRPGECAASLARYFSINLSKPWKTIQARLNFLQLCPSSNETPQMGTLVNAIAHGAGRCDAATLTATLRVWWGGDSGESYISNQMPDYCAAYVNHEYTDIDANEPKYVGTPETGGYWVEPAEYAAAQAAYEARMEELQRQREYVGGW
ncbi:MAG: conjugal transfer protein TrbM [Lysobacteraceae bacterium]|nr:MAG: conjugal transfer protein TrbM [Xanthomonadaceae bacterium]